MPTDQNNTKNTTIFVSDTDLLFTSESYRVEAAAGAIVVL